MFRLRGTQSMKFKNILFGSSIITILSGCASHKVVLLDDVFRLNEPYRVIEHNFEEKYAAYYTPPKTSHTVFSKDDVVHASFTTNTNKERSGSIDSESKEESKANNDFVESNNLAYIDIEFINESAVIKNTVSVANQIRSTLDGDKYLVVGHSHGKSSIGVETLASKRARFLSDVLKLAGIPKEDIFYISSFSDGGKKYDIPKGARVIALPSNLDQNVALLTGLSTNIEDKL